MAGSTAMPSPDSGQAWKERSRVVLTPVAAPAVLGWCSFAIASLLIGSHLAGWWGGEETLIHLAPFVLFVGLGQLLAGMWGFRAREPVATVVHGAWGFLWLGLGLAFTLVAFDLLTSTGLEMPLGFMLLAVGIITLGVAITAVFENIGLSVLTGLAMLAAGVTGIGMMSATTGVTELGGWLMVAAAAVAWYFSTAILVAEATGRQLLPIGRYRMAADVPGEVTTDAVAYSTGMPLLHEIIAGNGGEREERPVG